MPIQGGPKRQNLQKIQEIKSLPKFFYIAETENRNVELQT